MKNKTSALLMTALLVLTGCDSNKGGGSDEKIEASADEILNYVERKEVLASVEKNLLSYSSAVIEEGMTVDETSLYGDSDSSAAIVSSLRCDGNIKVYNNHLLSSDLTLTSSQKSGVLTVSDVSRHLSEARALENPDRVLSDPVGDSEYGLYVKKSDKTGAYANYGTSYSFSNNFSNSENLDAKFNSYAVQLLSFPSLFAFFFSRSGNQIKAYQSSSSTSARSNPLYPNDTTKNVNCVTSTLDTCVIEHGDDYGYRISSVSTQIRKACLTDFKGNGNDDAYAYSYGKISVSYEERQASNATFESQDYFTDYDNRPVLATYTRDSISSSTWTLASYVSPTNYSNEYQQIHGSGHQYAIDGIFAADDGLTAYALTSMNAVTKGLAPSWNRSNVTLDNDNIELKEYDNGTYFAISGATVTTSHTITVTLDGSYVLKTAVMN